MIEARAAIDVPVDDVEGSGLPRGVREIARENPVELGWGVLGRTAPGRRTNQERRERREQKEVLLDQVLFYSRRGRLRQAVVPERCVDVPDVTRS